LLVADVDAKFSCTFRLVAHDFQIEVICDLNLFFLLLDTIAQGVVVDGVRLSLVAVKRQGKGVSSSVNNSVPSSNSEDVSLVNRVCALFAKELTDTVAKLAERKILDAAIDEALQTVAKNRARYLPVKIRSEEWSQETDSQTKVQSSIVSNDISGMDDDDVEMELEEETETVQNTDDMLDLDDALDDMARGFKSSKFTRLVDSSDDSSDDDENKPNKMTDSQSQSLSQTQSESIETLDDVKPTDDMVLDATDASVETKVADKPASATKGKGKSSKLPKPRKGKERSVRLHSHGQLMPVKSTNHCFI
jgi:hypothetical protein